MRNLAVCLQEGQQREEGLELGRRAMEMTKDVLGEDHPDTIIAMANHAMGYYRQGETDKAEMLMNDVAHRSRVKLGDDHSSTLITKYN